MRIDSIEVRNLGTIKHAKIDLASIAGPLIAVTGDNGAGKSTTLELIAGGLFRQCPTRGTLGELATARDAMVEVRAVNGRRFTIRQTVDAISKKGETLVLDEHGEPLTGSAKVSAGDAWVQKHILSPDVFFASMFSAQGAGGFVALKPGERKAVLLRVLQIERLERLAEDARKRAASAKAEAESLRARITDEERRTPDMTEAKAELARLDLLAEQKSERAAAARVAVERAKAAAEDAAKAADIRERREAASKRQASCRQAIADNSTRIENNRNLLEREAEIREAVDQAPRLTAELAAANVKLTGIESELATAKAELARHTAQQQAEAQAGAAAEQRAIRATARLADRAVVEQAGRDLEDQRKHLAWLEAGHERAVGELAALQARMLGMAETRIDGLRGTLVDVIESVAVDRGRVASDGYERDNLAQLEQVNGPVLLADAQATVNEAAAMVTVARKQVSQLERDAARAPEMQAAADELEQAATAAHAAHDARAAAKAKAEEASATIAAHTGERDRERLNRDRIERDRATGAALIGMLPKLEAAQARIDELQRENESLVEQLRVISVEIEGLPDMSAPDVDLGSLERAVTEAERDERATRDECGRAGARVQAATDGLARLVQLRGQLTRVESELADWTRLAADLGRDGLQAMEIDAAVPELNALANDLLHSCCGSRFTVSLTTQRLDAKGKRELEGLDVRVLDTEHGRDDLLETFSGGEKVIVAEAVALALTTVACRRAGLERPTIVRDESGAALDPVNGRAYVAMLRRAAKLIGADKILYVSHTAELQELADARIEVRDGTVTVLA